MAHIENRGVRCPDTIAGVAEIVVLAAESTRDVDPFATLAGRLAERGYEVTLAAEAGFERLVPGGVVEFAPIRADFQSLLPTLDRNGPSLRSEAFPVMRGMLEDNCRVARGAAGADRRPPEDPRSPTRRGEARPTLRESAVERDDREPGPDPDGLTA